MADEGKFVWYEHLAPDPKAALAFYTEAVGWKAQPFGDDGRYTMLVSGQGPLGGVMALPPGATQAGARASWMGHVQVEDVDATVARATELGGKLRHPPEDVPTIGRFAVIADPQGATVSVYRPAAPMALPDSSREGQITWNELITADADAALRFYGELFGWKVMDTMDMGPMGTYSMYGVGDTMLGGIMKTPAEAPMPPTWFFYAETGDLEAAIARATRQGATVLNGPADVPGGRMAQLIDPQGAAFAFHQAASSAS